MLDTAMQLTTQAPFLRFGKVQQYLGALDWFGGMNSRLHVAHERIPKAWHHLNRGMPYHLDAVATVKRAVDG